MEYNQDVILEANDLHKLSETIINYDKEVKGKWQSALRSLGVNFDANKHATLQSNPIRDLTIHELDLGTRDIPRSWCSDAVHTNLRVSSGEVISVVHDKYDYKLTIPKGWRERQVVVDLTPIFEEGRARATEQVFIQKGEIVFTHHVHSTTRRNDTCTSFDRVTFSKAGLPETPIQVPLGAEVQGCFARRETVYHHHSGNQYTGGTCYAEVAYTGRCTGYLTVGQRHDEPGNTSNWTWGWCSAPCCQSPYIYDKQHMGGPEHINGGNIHISGGDNATGEQCGCLCTVYNKTCPYEEGQAMYDLLYPNCGFTNHELLFATIDYQ